MQIHKYGNPHEKKKTNDMLKNKLPYYTIKLIEYLIFAINNIVLNKSWERPSHIDTNSPIRLIIILTIHD